MGFGKGGVCRERKPGYLSLARQPRFSCLAAFLLAPRLDVHSQWGKMIVLQCFVCLWVPNFTDWKSTRYSFRFFCRRKKNTPLDTWCSRFLNHLCKYAKGSSLVQCRLRERSPLLILSGGTPTILVKIGGKDESTKCPSLLSLHSSSWSSALGFVTSRLSFSLEQTGCGQCHATTKASEQTTPSWEAQQQLLLPVRCLWTPELLRNWGAHWESRFLQRAKMVFSCWANSCFS